LKNRRLYVEVISIEGCRELLGLEAAGLSAEKIGAVRDHADAMARVLIESLLEQQSSSSENDDISTVR
jgi:hypothetical protein